jgi:hypothetical protein
MQRKSCAKLPYEIVIKRISAYRQGGLWLCAENNSRVAFQSAVATRANNATTDVHFDPDQCPPLAFA